MLKHHIEVLMPPQHLFTEDCGFIFRKEASQSQIAVSTISSLSDLMLPFVMIVCCC